MGALLELRDLTREYRMGEVTVHARTNRAQRGPARYQSPPLGRIRIARVQRSGMFASDRV